MQSVEESVVQAMDGTDTALFPFLPYILQDSRELGTDPAVVLALLREHFTRHDTFSLLDLGCGKGTVSVQAAKRFGCRCHGIDGIPAFIADAQQFANEAGVQHLCRFEVADIREAVSFLEGFDVVVLGSIGPVLGSYTETLTAVSRCMLPSGKVVLDDWYLDDDSDYAHPQVIKRSEMLAQIDAAGMEMVVEEVMPREDLVEMDDALSLVIERRCRELMVRYPEKRALFSDYIRRQHEMNHFLENRVTCATMLLQRRGSG
jgi:SAM-dependent methyltransferase